MSLLPRLFVLLVLLLPVSPGRAQAPASKDPKTIIIRDTEPEKDLETGMAKPPEPAIPPEEAYVDSYHRWKFKDGRQVELYAAGWEWKEREGPKGGRQWVLCLVDSGYRGNSFREKLSYPADEFEPTEAKNILKIAWKVYYVESKREKARVGYVKEAEAWMDRIAKYTGVVDPRVKDKPWLPGSDDPRVKQAPDIRKMQAWDLRRTGTADTKAARFTVVDWATGEPINERKEVLAMYYIKEELIPVRVRFEDGKEEVLASGWIGDDSISGFFQLALWNDWASLLRAGGEIPHRDLKIAALRDLAAQIWYRELFLKQTAKGPQVALAPLEAVDAADLAERSKVFRHGEKLSFPGLPPKGFQRPDTKRGRVQKELKLENFTPGPVGAAAQQCLGMSITLWMQAWQYCGFIHVNRGNGQGQTDAWYKTNMPKEMPPPQPNATLWPAFSKQMHDFAVKNFQGSYILQYHYDLDYTAANLERYTQGHDAKLLCLTVVEGKNQTGGVALPLIRAGGTDGIIEFGAFGGVVQAKLVESKTGHLPAAKIMGIGPKAVAKSAAGALTVQSKLPAMELEITGGTDSVVKKLKNVRLVLESNLHDGIMVVTPYERKY